MGISINQAKQVTSYHWAAKTSVMYWGDPGIGKSDGVRQLADETSYTIPKNEAVSSRSTKLAEIYGHEVLGRPVYDIRLLLCQPTDLKGIPVFNPTTGRGQWISTGMFPVSPAELATLEHQLVLYKDEHDDEGTSTARKYQLKGLIEELETGIEKGLKDQYAIIFLDEISVAPKMVQGAALQLVLDRSVGTMKLSDNVSIIAAGNRSSDRSGATAMSPPLASRFAHLSIAPPEYKDWLENYALPHNVPAPVVGFLKFREGLLHDYKPNDMTGSADAPSTFPCPRTWAKVGKMFEVTNILQTADNLTLETAVAGIIGEGAAAEFVAWLKVFNKLPDAQEVLDGTLKTIDFMKLARDGNKKDEPERDVRSRSLSLRYAFFHSLASLFVKKAGQYVTSRQKAREEGKTAEVDRLKKAFEPVAISFFEFINSDEDDVEYGMVILSNFLLRDRQILMILGELRSLPSKNATGSLDRILKTIEKYKAA